MISTLDDLASYAKALADGTILSGRPSGSDWTSSTST